MAEQTIKFYGAMWCGDTRRARRFFDDFGIPYQWIDIDEDKDAAETVKSLNNGFRSIPTILFPDGSKLTEPSNMALDAHLRELGLLKDEEE